MQVQLKRQLDSLLQVNYSKLSLVNLLHVSVFSGQVASDLNAALIQRWRMSALGQLVIELKAS